MIKFIYFLYRPLIFLMLAINTTCLGILTIVMSVFDSRGNIIHYIGKFWSWLNLKLSFVRVRIRGLRNIQAGRPYIVMSNHQSYYDVWSLIAYLPLQLRWVMKKELRSVPIFGYGCERMGHIYIDRGRSEQARKSLEAAGEKIRAGSSVVFFPEGTRSRDGKLLPFKKGGFVIALAAGVEILPITINRSRRVLPRDSIRMNPGTIEVDIHEPVAVDGYTYEKKEELMEEVRKIIAGKLET